VVSIRSPLSAIDRAQTRAIKAADLADTVRTAVINKRAGGMDLISGRKAFQKPVNDGVKLLNAIQDVYLDGKVTVA
jgi:fructose-bisphosphate aldolase, class I